MIIRRSDDVPSSSITPESVYLNRREFMNHAGVIAMGALVAPGVVGATSRRRQDLKVTDEDLATSYNNFYEFGTGKADPKDNAGAFKTKPWTVQVEGLVKAPKAYALDDLMRGLAVEDRVYRHRCVEAWSMVIPWRGVTMKSLINKLEPLPSAKFVQFTTLFDPTNMPGQKRSVLPWPYVEAMRMDEATNPLTLMVTGIYGKPLPNQNGAPLRFVTPWKYGFKGAKSIVKIRFTDTQPKTTWNVAKPTEYGFFGNVNPAVDHPRWSQAKERPAGAFLKIATLPFNGYADQVASMYAGMDLRINF
ncbi:MAG: protein-methionine-sulfoxide reductase catalytic subunit MsrP [Gemmatimonadota bacterium]|nr:protein-methionine-sulfoxide reductase catalytic subunit MsrP [Gemmatimonadota bacterium]